MSDIRFTLPLPESTLDEVDRLAEARGRSRNKQIAYMLQLATLVDLERLPLAQANEQASEYRRRLQRILDGDQ